MFEASITVLSMALGLAAGVARAGDVPDVQTIVNKANVVAYYQGNDGKATVQMVITSKQGQTRERLFNIVRKDVQDGGDQMYFVYFQRPADVRRMSYMVHKHAGAGKDDDRWLYMPALDLVKRIAAGDKRTSFVGSDFLYEDVSGRSLDWTIRVIPSFGARSAPPREGMALRGFGCLLPWPCR